MQKTIKEIVEETLAFYEEDPSRRAVAESGMCVYEADNGNRCAVGRCLLPEVDAKDLEGGVLHLHRNSDPIHPLALDPLLKEEYRGHPAEFWKELQTLHDCRQAYWGGAWIRSEEHYAKTRREVADRIINAYTTNPTN